MDRKIFLDFLVFAIFPAYLRRYWKSEATFTIKTFNFVEENACFWAQADQKMGKKCIFLVFNPFIAYRLYERVKNQKNAIFGPVFGST